MSSPLFTSEVIIYNAFYSRQKELNGIKFFSINMSDLRKFVNNLYDCIIGLGYKYVIIKCESESLNEFLDKDPNFSAGIEKIYCLKTLDEKQINKINDRYSDDIRNVLNKSDEIWNK